MKKTFFFTTCFYCFVLLSLLSCHSANNTPSETVRTIIAADNRGDIEKVISMYTTDAMLMPADRENISGEAAIRKNYEDIFLRSQMQLSPVIEEETRSGKFAYIKGMITGTVASKIDAGRIDVNDKFLMILKLESGGWKIHRLMWSRKG